MEALVIYNFCWNQNHCTFTLILLIGIVLYRKFPLTKFTDYKCFDMKSVYQLGNSR